MSKGFSSNSASPDKGGNSFVYLTNKATPGTGAVPTSITKDNVKGLMGAGGFDTDKEGNVTFRTRLKLDGHEEVVNLARRVEEKLKVEDSAIFLLPMTILAELKNILVEESSSSNSATSAASSGSSPSATTMLINNFEKKSKHFKKCRGLINALEAQTDYSIGKMQLTQILKQEILWTCSDFIWGLDEILFQIKPEKDEKKDDLAPAKAKPIDKGQLGSLAKIWGALKQLSKDTNAVKGLPTLITAVHDALAEILTGDMQKYMPLTKPGEDAALTNKIPSSLPQNHTLTPEQLEVIQGQIKIIEDFRNSLPKSAPSSSSSDDTVSRTLKKALRSSSSGGSSSSTSSNSSGASSSAGGTSAEQNNEQESYDMSSEFFAYRVLWGETRSSPEIQFNVQSGKKRPKGVSDDDHQGDHVTAYAVYLENFFSCISPIVEYQNLPRVVGGMLSLATESGKASETSSDQEVIADNKRRGFREERRREGVLNTEIAALDFLIKSYQIDHACRNACLTATQYLKTINKELGSSIPNIVNVSVALKSATTISLSTGGADEDTFMNQLRDVTTYVLTHFKINGLGKEIEDLRQDQSADAQKRVTNLSAQLESCRTRQAELLSRQKGVAEDRLSLRKLQTILSGSSSSSAAASSDQSYEGITLDTFIKEVALNSMKACFDFDPAFYLLLTNPDRTHFFSREFQGVIGRHFRIMGVALAPLLSSYVESKNICGEIADGFIAHLSAKEVFDRTYREMTPTQKNVPLILLTPESSGGSSSGDSKKQSSSQENIASLRRQIKEFREKIKPEVAKFFQGLRVEGLGEPSLQQEFVNILKQRAEAYQAVTTQNVKGINSSKKGGGSSLFGDDDDTDTPKSSSSASSSSTASKPPRSTSSLLSYDNNAATPSFTSAGSAAAATPPRPPSPASPPDTSPTKSKASKTEINPASCHTPG